MLAIKAETGNKFVFFVRTLKDLSGFLGLAPAAMGPANCLND
jgi:hypothetical protein